MKYCFKVLHDERNISRSDHVVRTILKNRVHQHLNNFAETINSKTITIDDEEKLKAYYLNNKNAKVHPEGYTGWEGIKGWKYGELGIWASNIEAWLEFKNNDSDLLIVFEDDVEIRDNFVDLLPTYINSLPKDWEVFSIYTSVFEWNKYKEEYSLGEDSPIAHSFHEVNLACYIINKKFVNKILDILKDKPIDEPIDLYIFGHPRKFNSYDLKLNVPQIVKRQYIVPSTFQNSQAIMSMDCLKDE